MTLPAPQTPQDPSQDTALQGQVSKFLGRPAPASPDNFPSGADAYKALPNAEKLTPLERNIYQVLPSVSNSPVGQILETFGKSLPGKVLSYLDVGAEGIERTLGTALQFGGHIANPQDNFDLRAAWYASSLTYDTTELPVFTFTTRPATSADVLRTPGIRVGDPIEVVNGLRIPNDLPGPMNGLPQIRNDIQKYVSFGMTYHDALAKARDDYYSGLGAVALRAQLHDLYGHALLDPSWLLAALKPVDALQAARTIALNKSAYTAEDLTKLADVEKAAGNLEKAAQYTQFADKVSSGDIKVVNRLDKLAIMATGGDIYNPSKFSETLSKVPFLKGFMLSNESKAQEAVNMLVDNFSSRVIGNYYHDINAEEKITAAADRIAQGAVGAEFGHAIITPEGRAVQALATADKVYAQGLYEGYKAIETERGVLETISNALGMEPSKILKQIKEGPEALFGLISKDANAAQFVPTLDDLKTLGAKLQGMPYNKDMFIAQLMDQMETHAMRQAVLMFGVKERGVITRWANALKAAESLAFMRLNPAYPIRNAINNEVTVIARGVFNMMSPEEINAFWKQAGFIPHRLSEGFHAGSELELGSNAVMREAVYPHYGTPEKIQDFFRKLSLGKIDASAWARTLEKSASQRAFTQGYKEFFHSYYKPTALQDIVDSATLDELQRNHPEVLDLYNQAIHSAQGSEQAFKEALAGNLNTNSQAVIDEASRTLGHNVADDLGPEVVSYIHENLPTAIQNGKVDSFLAGVNKRIDKHINDLFDKTVQDLADATEAQVRAGGPQVWYKKLSDSQLMWLNGESEHAIKITPATDAVHVAQEAGDYKKVNSLWRKIMDDDMKHFQRLEQRMNGIYDGLERGWKALNDPALPSITEVRRTFNDTRKAYRDFFEFRNKTLAEFFDAKLSGKEYTTEFDKLQAEFGVRYDNAANIEAANMHAADDAVAAMIQDPALKKAFMNYRDQVANLTTQLRTDVENFRATLATVPAEQRQAAYQAFWQDRMNKLNDLKYMESGGAALMQGDPKAAQMFSVPATSEQPRAANIYDLSQQYGIAPTTSRGNRNDQRILNTVNKYAKENPIPATILDPAATSPDITNFTRVEDIPLDIAQQAFEQRAAEKGLNPPRVPSQQYISDVKSIAPDPMPLDLITQEANYGRVQPALSAVVDAAKNQMAKPAKLLQDLPPNLQEKVQAAIEHSTSELSDARYAATKFAGFRRDAALLNYNRRTNFDNWGGNFFPYVFWTTGSMQKWAVETMNRPGMLTNYLRMQKLLETAGAPQDGFPSRFKDNIRIKLPFAPSWMGDQFIDPLRLVFPFKGFAQPFEDAQNNQATLEGRAQRLLQNDLSSGKITQKQYQDAISTKQGPEWQLAVSQAEQNDSSLKYDAWDFATTMASPHAPIIWAYNALTGHPENTGPFTPIDRMMRNTATILGVQDWNNSQYNVMAKIRKSMGLPAYDKWDDYRIDREISNLSVDGKFSLDDVKHAMAISAQVQEGRITSADAENLSPVYKEAVTRANVEYSGGKAGAVLSFLGLNVHALPEGEAQLRSLQTEFSDAYGKYHQAQQTIQNFVDKHPELEQQTAVEQFDKKYPGVAKQAQALTDFFNKHPEYETRLGLFDKPEVRLKKFMVDQVWAKWNDLPTLTKRELASQLGPTFNDAFLNKNTRSYDSLTSEQMAMWLKLMGGKEPGVLNADQNMLADLFSGQLKTTKPETAWRAQVFYETRDKNYPNWYKLQSAYYALPVEKRRAYADLNPELNQYWIWRRSFLQNNPDIVPYLTDSKTEIAKAQNARRNPNVAVPTASEIPLSPTMKRVIASYQQGAELPQPAQEQLRLLAGQYGISERDIYGILGLEMP